MGWKMLKVLKKVEMGRMGLNGLEWFETGLKELQCLKMSWNGLIVYLITFWLQHIQLEFERFGEGLYMLI